MQTQPVSARVCMQTPCPNVCCASELKLGQAPMAPVPLLSHDAAIIQGCTHPFHFAESRPEALQALIEAHPLGAVITQTENGLNADHIPFEYAAPTDRCPVRHPACPCGPRQPAVEAGRRRHHGRVPGSARLHLPFPVRRKTENRQGGADLELRGGAWPRRAARGRRSAVVARHAGAPDRASRGTARSSLGGGRRARKLHRDAAQGHRRHRDSC